MRELSLFTGAGGGVLGSKILGWKTLGYVENNGYCQKVIKQRISDGIFDDSPVFGDIRLFIEHGFADQYRGRVDVVTAGFPCQPFSVAGKRAGEFDPRNMWPETIECIRRVRPRYALLENVPGIMATTYFWKILEDLCESGYDAEWEIVSASDVGANHRRKRLWILAHTRQGCKRIENLGRNEKGTPSEFSGCCKMVANSNSKHCKEYFTEHKLQKKSRKISLGWNSCNGKSWWSTEPRLGRVANGVANRTHRLKAIGNGQVSLTMAYAFSKLFARIA